LPFLFKKQKPGKLSSRAFCQMYFFTTSKDNANEL